MRYLTRDELLYINGRVLNDARLLLGQQKIRDMDLLEAAVGRPMQSVFGQDAYPTLREKAAVLLHSLARNHPFKDGNKRTATVGLLFMLAVNGLRVNWQPEQALQMILTLAQGQQTPAYFAQWLPLEEAGPPCPPDAEQDMATIERLMGEHRWLLDELDKR